MSVRIDSPAVQQYAHTEDAELPRRARLPKVKVYNYGYEEGRIIPLGDGAYKMPPIGEYFLADPLRVKQLVSKSLGKLGFVPQIVKEVAEQNQQQAQVNMPAQTDEEAIAQAAQKVAAEMADLINGDDPYLEDVGGAPVEEAAPVEEEPAPAPKRRRGRPPKNRGSK